MAALPTWRAYEMYSVRGMNPGGPTMQSVVMLYPDDHNFGYVSPADQPEFGSLGPVGFIGPGDAMQLRGAYEIQRYHRSATQHSSPDQPSSPHFSRSVAQKNYYLKEEDFPPLVYQDLGRDGGRIFSEKHHQTLVFVPQA